MLRLKHLFRLTGEFGRYTAANRTWWLLPLVALLGLMTLLVVAGSTAAPYTVYTLF